MACEPIAHSGSRNNCKKNLFSGLLVYIALTDGLFSLQNINWKINMFEKLFLLKHLNDCKQPFLILYTLTQKINLHKFTLLYNF